MIDLLRRLIRAYRMWRKRFTICPCGMPLTEAEIKQNKLWKRSSTMYCADCFEREFPSSIPQSSGTVVRGSFTELLAPGLLKDLYDAQQGPTQQHPLAALMNQQVAGLQDPAALQNMAHQSGMYQMQMLQDQNRRSLTNGLLGTACSDPVASLLSSLFGGGRNGIQH